MTLAGVILRSTCPDMAASVPAAVWVAELPPQGVSRGAKSLWPIGAFSALRSNAERKCPNKNYTFCKKARARSGRSVGDDVGGLSVYKLREHYDRPIFGGRMNGEKRGDARLSPPLRFLFLSCETIFCGIDVGHFVETLCQHIIRCFGIYLCRFDVRVPQHPTDHFDADALRQRVGRCERMAPQMVGDRLVDSDLDGDSFQDAVTVGDVGHRQYEVRSRDLASVFVDDSFGNAA